MRQRVGIALALALEPSLVILDEPTTALDVIVEREILDQIRALRARLGVAVLFITHDLARMLQFSDRVAVFYAGRLVEVGPSAELRPGAAASLHARPPQVLPHRARRHDRARKHPGRAAESPPSPSRLSLPSALRPRRGSLPRGVARAGRARAGTCRRVSPRGAGCAGAGAGAGGEAGVTPAAKRA